MCLVSVDRDAGSTHLYDHAQVTDVHPLGFDDLHDDPVQVCQLRVGGHGAGDKRRQVLPPAGDSTRRRLLVIVVAANKAEAPTLPVSPGAPHGAQVQVDVGV